MDEKQYRWVFLAVTLPFIIFAGIAYLFKRKDGPGDGPDGNHGAGGSGPQDTHPPQSTTPTGTNFSLGSLASIASLYQMQEGSPPPDSHANSSDPEPWKWVFLIAFFATTAILHRIFGKKKNAPKPGNNSDDDHFAGPSAGGPVGRITPPSETPPASSPNSAAMSILTRNGPPMGILYFFNPVPLAPLPLINPSLSLTSLF